MIPQIEDSRSYAVPNYVDGQSGDVKIDKIRVYDSVICLVSPGPAAGQITVSKMKLVLNLNSNTNGN